MVILEQCTLISPGCFAESFPCPVPSPLHGGSHCCSVVSLQMPPLPRAGLCLYCSHLGGLSPTKSTSCQMQSGSLLFLITNTGLLLGASLLG